MAARQIPGAPPTRIGPGPHGYITVYDVNPLFFPLYALHRYDKSDRCPRYDPKQEKWIITLPDPGPADPSVEDFLEALKYPFFVPRLRPELAWTPSHHPSYNVFRTRPYNSGPYWALHHEEVLNLCHMMERLVDCYERWFRQLQPRPMMLATPPRGGSYDKAKAIAPRIMRDPEHLKDAMNTLFAWYVRALGWLIHLRMSLLGSTHVVREHELLKHTKWFDQEADHRWHISQDLLTRSMAAYDPSRSSPGVVLHNDVSDETANGFLAQRVLCWDLLKKTTQDVCVSLRLKWSWRGPASGLIHITPPSDGCVIHEHQRQVVRVDSQWGEWRHDLFYKPESLETERRANHGQEKEGLGDSSANSGHSVTRAKAASARAEGLQGVTPPWMSNAPARPAAAPPQPVRRLPPPLTRPLSPPPAYSLTPPISMPSPTQCRRNLSRGRECSQSRPSLPKGQSTNPARHAASPEEVCTSTEQHDHGPFSRPTAHQPRSRSPRTQPNHSGASRTRLQTSPTRFRPYLCPSPRPESQQLPRTPPDTPDVRGAVPPSSSTSRPPGGLDMNLNPDLLRFLAQNSSSVEVKAPGGTSVVFHLARNVDQSSASSSRSTSTRRPDAQPAPSLASQLADGRASRERPEPLPEQPRPQPSPVPPGRSLLWDRLDNVGPSEPVSSQPSVSPQVALVGVPAESASTTTSRRPFVPVTPSVASGHPTSSSRSIGTSTHGTHVPSLPPQDVDMIG